MASSAQLPDGVTPPSKRAQTLRRIGDVIVDLGFASRKAVETAAEDALRTGLPTGQMLLEDGVVTPDQLARAVAERYGLPYVDLNAFPVDPGAAALVEPALLRRLRAIPVAFIEERVLLVATADPANVLAVDDLGMMTGFEIRRAMASAAHVDALLGRLGHLEDAVHEIAAEEAREAEAQAEVIELRESAADAPIVKVVRSVIAEAVERGASDIHFDPEGSGMRVRFRVDGVVSDSTAVPRSMVAGLVSRIKIMADLDISERRQPQDGRVGIDVGGRHVDIRVATLPIVRGEAVVMRILDKDRALVKLDALGMGDPGAERFRNAIARTHGAVLATGPTGSGKSTTLYAALREINTPDKTLITIEDPVEYELDGVKQVQVSARNGVTFATGLRAMMRSDPDVMMVGEIRDRDTARIAIESALTGHLVLSTLHTNDAPISVARLIEMGIEPYLVASGVSCVVAQRLTRRLCVDCRRESEVKAEALHRNGFPLETESFVAYEPGGCALCAGTGYRGRLGVYEVMEVTDELRALIVEKRPAEALAEVAVAQGMRRLREEGLEKVRAGETSMAEVLRVLGGAA